MNTNSLIISAVDGTINAFVNGKAYTLAAGGYYYPMALEAAKARDYQKLIEAIDLDSAVKNKSNGKVTFEDGVLRYNGAKIDNKLSERVIKMVAENETIKPIMKFIELCYLNPNPSVIDRLYDFMLCNSIMLGDNGYIVGYKGVRPTGYDWYSNTVLYEVGKESRIPRSECDEDSRNTCSSGLHLGTLGFARGWVRDGKLILCQINPENVTAIPEESGYPKLRCCAMDVLQDVSYLKTEGVFQEKGVYSPDFDSNDPNFDKDVDLSDENDEYPNCGCNCDICSLDNSDDSDNEDENDSENNEDDNIDYDKYDKGWDYMDYLNLNNYKDTSSRKPAQLRNNYGQFSHGNTPIAKRGPGGRFVKS